MIAVIGVKVPSGGTIAPMVAITPELTTESGRKVFRRGSRRPISVDRRLKKLSTLDIRATFRELGANRAGSTPTL